MDLRIDKIEDKLNEISYRLNFLDKTNETQAESFDVVNSTIQANTKFTKKVINEFELINLKLKNTQSEIEILNIEIRTLKIMIEAINIKLGMIE